MAKKKASPAPKAPSPDRIIRSVVMPPDLDAELNELAKKEDRALSWLIVKAVREMLERVKVKQ